jgi:hypothetical protein
MVIVLQPSDLHRNACSSCSDPAMIGINVWPGRGALARWVTEKSDNMESIRICGVTRSGAPAEIGVTELAQVACAYPTDPDAPVDGRGPGHVDVAS